jgi:hypothetical protein
MALSYSYISASTSYSVVLGSCTAGAVIIPSTYNDGINGTRAVTSIGASAFERCYGLTAITIPDSVTKIENFAFYLCTSLTEINIGNSVTTIGLYAFVQTAISNIIIPNSVITISAFAFQNCYNLTSINIPSGVVSIGGGLFAGCSSLIRVNFLGNFPSFVGTDIFLSTNANLKIYRKKNFVTGWSSTFGGKPVVLISDNVVKSGGTGKLTTKKRN